MQLHWRFSECGRVLKISEWDLVRLRDLEWQSRKRKMSSSKLVTNSHSPVSTTPPPHRHARQERKNSKLQLTGVFPDLLQVSMAAAFSINSTVTLLLMSVELHCSWGKGKKREVRNYTFQNLSLILHPDSSADQLAHWVNCLPVLPGSYWCLLVTSLTLSFNCLNMSLVLPFQGHIPIH